MRKKGDKGKKKKKKGGGFNMMPMMIVPQMIMLGMLPFALANLKVIPHLNFNSVLLNFPISDDGDERLHDELHGFKWSNRHDHPKHGIWPEKRPQGQIRKLRLQQTENKQKT